MKIVFELREVLIKSMISLDTFDIYIFFFLSRTFYHRVILKRDKNYPHQYYKIRFSRKNFFLRVQPSLKRAIQIMEDILSSGNIFYVTSLFWSSKIMATYFRFFQVGNVSKQLTCVSSTTCYSIERSVYLKCIFYLLLFFSTFLL